MTDNENQRLTGPYAYDLWRPDVFTEKGQVIFLEVRDHIKAMIAKTGAITLEHAIEKIEGDNQFLSIACVDRLVELGELVEIKRPGTASNYTVYVPGRNYTR